MKKLPILIMCILLSAQTQASCPLIPLSIDERVQISDVVLEAEVMSRVSYFNNAQNFIYTSYHLKVHKVFKGENIAREVVLVTEGGMVDHTWLQVSPNLEPETGQKGLFFLNTQHSYPVLDPAMSSYYSQCGPLGLISYDPQGEKAWDMLGSQGNIKPDLYAKVRSLTEDYVEYDEVEITTDRGTVQRRFQPIISSFSPTNMPSGTREPLVIKGSGFGFLQGNGYVEFLNADNGGGSYVRPLKQDYLSWTDTQITVLVQRRAGTGPIRVANAFNNMTETQTELTLSWAHINVTPGDTISWETRLTAPNSNQGFEFVWDQTLYQNKPAVASFLRALESWRCKSLVNWDTLGVAPNDTQLRDGKNMVFFDTKGWLPQSTLGVCYTWFNGCIFQFPQYRMEWYVSEIDIVFKQSVNWEFGPQPAAQGKTDFESVALHELGHGLMLGHVINPLNIMHYSLGAEENKRTLQDSDIQGAQYVLNKSTTSVCGVDPMVLILEDNCRFTSLEAQIFVDTNSACLLDSFMFTYTSNREPDTWIWNFGEDAVPPNASTQGPHKVYYTQPGKKSITLTIRDEDEQLTVFENQMVDVINNRHPLSVFEIALEADTRFQFINRSVGNNTYLWDFGDGSNTSTDSNAVHSYEVDPEGLVVSLIAENICGADTAMESILDYASLRFAQPDPILLYPNPASEHVYLETEAAVTSIECFDMQGRKVLLEEWMPLHDSKYVVSVKTWAPGLYTWVITTPRHVYVQKLGITNR